MHKIYIGYSSELSFTEMRNYLDIDNTHENLKSNFEKDFHCEYIDPGDYEIYDKNTYSGLDASLAIKLFPFTVDLKKLSEIPFEKIQIIFFIKSSSLNIHGNNKIVLLDPITIDKFHFE